MQAQLQAHLAFHLTGKRLGGELDALDALDLRPALFAGYRNLSELRYDFPLVLIRDGADTSVQSLSGLFDRILSEIADGVDGERLRQHALQLEQEIRSLCAQGPSGPLLALWDTAASHLTAHNDELLQDSLRRLSAAFKVDGEVIDCDKAMPFRLFHHAWKVLNDKKARAVRGDIDRLVTKLSDILAADFARSPQGVSAERLKASIGATQQEAFDFAALSRLFVEALPPTPLPEPRRQRIQWLLSVLKSQRFFPAVDASGKSTEPVQPYSFVFENCAEAVEAFRDRLPEVTKIAKALAIAALEVDGRYHAATHDVLFEDFGADGLDPEELARFPDYLLCVRNDDIADVWKAFATGLPAKVVVQTDDLLQPAPNSREPIALAAGGNLASTAIGLSSYYVLQSSSSNLFQLREQIFRGFAYPGPALFSVFSGATANAGSLPPYLTAAAAMESRAFPAFAYDPSAGSDLASRFQVHGNPQPDLDWPVQNLAYEDEAHQSISESVPFTLIDFVACDRRYAKHFARVPRAKWNGTMAPVAEFLAPEPKELADKVPCLLMVDRDNVLQKVIVDDKLIREARRCADMWRGLQELGGIHNSHATRLLEKERKAWTEKLQQETASQAKASGPGDGAQAAPVSAQVSVPAAAPAKAPEQAEPEKSSDDPYIETPRCTSCNECTQINDKMFGYDANKQASIVNPDAGTYRQLVEAAESCQVSIIHPGKPRNPNEPDLEELMKRAEAFL